MSAFNFNLKTRDFPALHAKSTKELFQKWGMVKMDVKLYSYDNFLETANQENFVALLLQHTGISITRNMKLEIELIPATILNMSFFDRLYSGAVVRECGAIKKCFDEMCGEFLVSDELRKSLLSQESENFHLYSTEERREFMFRIFQHVVLGGYCNQYEDNLKPYTELTKHIYKDLLHVFKDKETGQLKIGSLILHVQVLDEAKRQIFPGTSENIQNFCYLIINSEKREVILWKHTWNL